MVSSWIGPLDVCYTEQETELIQGWRILTNISDFLRFVSSSLEINLEFLGLLKERYRKEGLEEDG